MCHPVTEQSGQYVIIRRPVNAGGSGERDISTGEDDHKCTERAQTLTHRATVTGAHQSSATLKNARQVVAQWVWKRLGSRGWSGVALGVTVTWRCTQLVDMGARDMERQRMGANCAGPGEYGRTTARIGGRDTEEDLHFQCPGKAEHEL